MQNYDFDHSKIRIISFGANIECNRNLSDIKEIVKARPSDKCKLLFLGVDWFRKGGDIALEVTRLLNNQGLPTELTVVGSCPAVNGGLRSFVKILGFVSKSSEEGRKQIDSLLAESHFLILPSMAEGTPIVFCEANSFGTSGLGMNVGGVSSVIRDGVNGYLFEKEALPIHYCNYIL
jgi:glycosyltransferase involved in cell wall biosynthesis